MGFIGSFPEVYDPLTQPLLLSSRQAWLRHESDTLALAGPNPAWTTNLL